MLEGSRDHCERLLVHPMLHVRLLNGNQQNCRKERKLPTYQQQRGHDHLKIQIDDHRVGSDSIELADTVEISCGPGLLLDQGLRIKASAK